jgi:prephenate dehydrogenase
VVVMRGRADQNRSNGDSIKLPVGLTERRRPDLFARMVIVGGAGEVGRLVARVMGPVVGELEVVDLRPEPRSGLPPCTYSTADVRDWVNSRHTLLRNADCLVLAVPEEIALEVLEPIAARMSGGALLVDTLSVKGAIVARLAALPRHLEKLSLNPMFAPSLGVRDQTILAIEVLPGARSSQLLQQFRASGARVRFCDADFHDASTATLQVLTHAALLSFGVALENCDQDLDALLSIAPPPFVALTALLARILSGNALTYLDIQASNARAGAMRARLVEGVRELDRAVDGGAPSFLDLHASLAGLLDPKTDDLERKAQHLLEGLQP